MRSFSLKPLKEKYRVFSRKYKLKNNHHKTKNLSKIVDHQEKQLNHISGLKIEE
jgi:hypothetical protein